MPCRPRPRRALPAAVIRRSIVASLPTIRTSSFLRTPHLQEMDKVKHASCCRAVVVLLENQMSWTRTSSVLRSVRQAMETGRDKVDRKETRERAVHAQRGASGPVILEHSFEQIASQF